LSGDVAESSHGEEVRDGNGKPIVEGIGYEEGAEHAAHGTFPGFFGRDVRGERMFADGAADEVGGGVGGPGDGQGEQEEAGAVERKLVGTNGERKRKSNEEKRAGGNSGGGQRFDEGAASEKSEYGEAEEEEEKESGGGIDRSHLL